MRFTRVLYISLIFFAGYKTTIAQSSYDDPNALTMPSVNNDFLKAQSDFDISLYTGTPNINIPLYSLPSRELNIPVSLSYANARGVRVQDIAGFVGLGWQLNAGGNISRVVRGRPDETDSGYIGIHLFGQTLNTGVTTDLVNKVGNGYFDGEPDLFTVTTPFFSFRFVLDENGLPVFPDNTGLSISHNLYNNASYQLGTSWVIKDASGNQYFFGTTAASRENITTTLFSKSQTCVSTWYLDKIISYNSKDIINFTYTAGSDYSVNHYLASQTVFTASGQCSAPSPVSSSYSQVSTYNAPKYISKITSTLGEVDFTYVYDRSDIVNAGRLTTITIYPYDPASQTVTNALKLYQFNYSYFGNTPSNPDAMRLKLDYINLYGSVPTVAPLKYKSFDYNTAVSLPPRNSVEFDYWGYYNTNSSGTSLVPAANKSPDGNRVQANILTGIHDLSGEVLQLQYEQNTYYKDASAPNAPTAGLRVAQISKTYTSGQTLTTQYTYTDASNNSTGQNHDQNYLNFNKLIGLIAPVAGGGCFFGGTSTTSETPYDSYDLNGNFVGYSTVKVTYPNGGFEINTFNNFNDFPDIFNNYNTNSQVYDYQSAPQLCAATSLSYKRGLLKDKLTCAANGNKISEVKNIYNSLDQPMGKALSLKASLLTYLVGNGTTTWIYGTYVNNVENYVVTQKIETNFDQNDQSLTQQKISNYTYAANHRLIQRVDYTDSKGLARSKTSYYTEDAGIPYLTGNEQYAITTMLQGNQLNAVIHSIESNNGTANNTHYSYLSFIDASVNNKVLLANKKTSINNSGETETQQCQYDVNSANLTAINKLGGPFLSTSYGYNNSYAIAKVRNAINISNVATSQGSQNGAITIPANDNFSTWNASFVVDYTGTVTLSISFGGGGTSGTLIRTIEYNLAGPTNTYNGILCNSPNGTCAFGSSVTLTNVAPGNYTLSVNPQTSNNTATINAFFNYSYPKYQATTSGVNEFFYEGFESTVSAATLTPFAGKRYYSGAYTVPFIIPNARTYQIDYHYLSSGSWHAVTKAYQNNMVLNDGSAVDEVRIYPSDAQMNTYTYDPLNGITSQCDLRNRFTFYEYDNFGRLKTIRDNDGNIISTYDYQYQVNSGQTCPAPTITSVTNGLLTLSVNYTAPSGSTSCNFNILDQTSGQTIVNSTTACSSPVTFTIPSRNDTYIVTVTSYTPDCPAGVTSNPQVVTISQ